MNLWWIVCIAFSYCLQIASGTSLLNSNSSSSKSHQSPETPEDYPWKPLLEIPDEIFGRMVIPTSIDWQSEIFTSNSSLSLQCRTVLKLAVENVHQRKAWAVNMFNSWAKFPPSGIWHGTMTDFGDYDQCMDVAKSAHYCLIDVSMPMPEIPKWHNLHQSTKVFPESDSIALTNRTRELISAPDGLYSDLANVSAIFYYVYVQTGICLPDECTSEPDVRALGNLNAAKLGMKVTKFSCNSNQRTTLLTKLDNAQLCAIILLLSVVSYNLFVFLADKFGTFNESQMNVWYLKWFNPAANIRKILYSQSSDELTCVHGLRFLTILWIITGHTLEWNNLNFYRQTFTLRNRLSDLASQPFYKAHFSVDTFFYLSGLLTSYVTLKYTRSSFHRLSIGSFLSLRYLRLTPQLAVFLLLSSLLPALFDGPLWSRYMASLNDRCQTNWWINMLYLQNIVDLQNICAIHTWYLAVDMQLHWFALIPIIALLLNRKYGLTLSAAIVVSCTAFSAVWVFVSNLPPGTVVTSRNNFLDEQGRPSDYLLFFYKPWTHGAVFFTGFIFGCFVEQFTNKKVQISTIKQYSLWILVAAIYLFCIFSTTPWLYGAEYDRYWSAFLHPLNMFLWAAMLSIIVWLCITNNGRIVDRLLSSPSLRPLSRITYCVYLVHPWAFAFIIATKRELLHPSMSDLFAIFMPMIVLSYLIGFVFTVLFEAPLFHALECHKRSLENSYLASDLENGNNNTNESKTSELDKEMQSLTSICSNQEPLES